MSHNGKYYRKKVNPVERNRTLFDFGLSKSKIAKTGQNSQCENARSNATCPSTSEGSPPSESDCYATNCVAEPEPLVSQNLNLEIVKDAGLRACFPRVLQIYELCLLIPQSTAVVERTFSLMNDICSFLRTSLTTKTLDALMRINGNRERLSDESLEEIVDIFKCYKSREMPL